MSSKYELMKEFSLAEEKEKAVVDNTDSIRDSKPVSSEETKPQHLIHTHGHKRKKRKFIKAIKSMFRDKTFNKMLNVFLLCMVVNAIEYFVIINRFGIITHGALGKVFGIFILLGYMYNARLKVKNIGLIDKPRVIFRGLKNAFIFNLAIIPAYLIEYVYYLLKGQTVIFRVFAYTAYYSKAGAVGLIANILLLLVINAISAVMLEVLFRGILIKTGKPKFGFWQTTVIVSIFYSLWYLIIPLSKVTSGYKPGSILTLCIFYVVFEFMISIKWCMCARATGSIWLSVFDHFIFTTSVGLIHVISYSETGSFVDVSRNYRLIIIQAISFVLCFIYYKRKMRKKEQMLMAVGVHNIYSFDSLANMSEEDVSRQAERIKTADGEIDSEYLKHLEKLNLNDDKR